MTSEVDTRRPAPRRTGTGAPSPRSRASRCLPTARVTGSSASCSASRMHSEQLEHERLGKPTALAVFASDNLSSSAYATEEILHVLVPAVGIAAFSLVMPITVGHAGGAGPADPQLPGDDQGVPVGGRRLPGHPRQLRHRARPGGGGGAADRLHPHRGGVGGGRQRRADLVVRRRSAPCRVPISLGFIVLIAFGNLRGVRESGRIFAAPTYFFMANMAVLLGLRHGALLRRATCRWSGGTVEGMVEFGDEGTGLLLGASAFVLAKAFASGGCRRHRRGGHLQRRARRSSKPEWRNARQTLVVMGSGLAVMFLGLSFLASQGRGRPVRGRHADRARPDRRGRLRPRAARRGAVERAPGRHHAHPRAGGQHRLRRLPPPGQPPGRRQLPAPPAHQARPPPGVLQRHHRPRRRRRRARGAHRRRGHQADPALRHRRVHRASRCRSRA